MHLWSSGLRRTNPLGCLSWVGDENHVLRSGQRDFVVMDEYKM